jgi:Uma2 family endonuclease
VIGFDAGLRTLRYGEVVTTGIGEYWIVNPFDRQVEVCRLRGADYVLVETATDGPWRPAAFPGLEIDLKPIWAVLD